MKHILVVLFIALLTFGIAEKADAQCQKYAKNKCVPVLEPFIFNGQMNSVVLNEGDIAELVISFYAGQEYRVLICGEDQLGEIGFKLKDLKDKVLFDNRDHDYATYWDFVSSSSQKLIIEVEVPETSEDSDVVKNGCIAILVGFKESE